MNNLNVCIGEIFEVFRLNKSKYRSKFTINIESLLTNSMNIFLYLQTIIYWYAVSAAFQKIFKKINCVCFKIIYLMTKLSLFSTFKHYTFLIKIVGNTALNYWKYFIQTEYIASLNGWNTAHLAKNPMMARPKL